MAQADKANFLNDDHDMMTQSQNGRLLLYWVFLLTYGLTFILACNVDEEERAQMPSFPFDAKSIEESVLQPNGSLLRVPTDELASFWIELSEELETNSALITQLLSTIFPEEDTLKSQGSTATFRRAVTVENSVNGWADVVILCGPRPSEHRAEDGLIRMTYTLSSTLDDSFVPSGFAWGSFESCQLWGESDHLTIGGAFGLILPQEQESVLFIFEGEEMETYQRMIETRGRLNENEMGLSITISDQSIVAGWADDVPFIDDCFGRWSCTFEERNCHLTNPNAPNAVCRSPESEEVTW